MKKITNSSIVFVLAGIFIFPLLFQSLHNIVHHLSDADIAVHSDKHGLHYIAHQAACPILSFEIATLDLPSILKTQALKELIVPLIASLYNSPYLRAKDGIRLLRAPPGSIFTGA